MPSGKRVIAILALAVVGVLGVSTAVVTGNTLPVLSIPSASTSLALPAPSAQAPVMALDISHSAQVAKAPAAFAAPALTAVPKSVALIQAQATSSIATAQAQAAAAAKAAATAKAQAASAAAAARPKAPTVAPVRVVSSSQAARRMNAMNIALGKLGSPYRWGASGPYAFDCSGLMKWAFAQAGIQLPRTSRDQSTVGMPVAKANLQPGDLVFFYSPVSHVAMYIGGGKVVQASTSSQPVKISPLAGMPFHNARRV